MSKSWLPVVVALTVLGSAAAVAGVKLNSANYNPPAQTGTIYTVIDFPRVQGRNQGVLVEVDWGTTQRRFMVSPYGRCQLTSPSGFVLKLRHRRPGSEPLRLSTTGTIIRGPYQGEIPMEVLHDCYRLKL
jgi:hypothetical protein